MTENQRKALQDAHKAIAIAQNNLASSRASAIAFDDVDLWDKYQRAMDGIIAALTESPAQLLQLTEAEVGNLWHQHLTKLPHEASAAEFIAGVRAGASAVRQKAGLAEPAPVPMPAADETAAENFSLADQMRDEIYAWEVYAPGPATTTEREVPA